MGRPKGWMATQLGREPMRSPGRPPAWRREHRQSAFEPDTRTSGQMLVASSPIDATAQSNIVATVRRRGASPAVPTRTSPSTRPYRDTPRSRPYGRPRGDVQPRRRRDRAPAATRRASTAAGRGRPRDPADDGSYSTHGAPASDAYRTVSRTRRPTRNAGSRGSRRTDGQREFREACNLGLSATPRPALTLLLHLLRLRRQYG